ncbi:hypothetical protein [Peribacillus frigoritolerans]|uniref:Uncharacterized protein n=1 Tax=Peribacillus castrilensis TaxID=2897690 RepID=A0AAW9NHY4_9BACI|nr:hypothetical protein [Peribacillus castrilensis]
MILIQDFLCDEIYIESLEPRPRLMLAVRVFGRPSTLRERNHNPDRKMYASGFE